MWDKLIDFAPDSIMNNFVKTDDILKDMQVSMSIAVVLSQ